MKKKIKQNGGDKKMKRKTIVGLIAIVAIVMVAIFAGCVDEEAPSTTPAPTATSTPETAPASTATPIPTPTPTPLPEPKYAPGDMIVSSSDKIDGDYVHVVLKYDKDTDEYEINLFHRTDQRYVGFIDRHSRTFTEKLYPIIAGHIDLSTVSDTPKYDPDIGVMS